jgi:hypothetical protein
LKGRDPDLGSDGRIILKSILKEQNWRVWAEFVWQST